MLRQVACPIHHVMLKTLMKYYTTTTTERRRERVWVVYGELMCVEWARREHKTVDMSSCIVIVNAIFKIWFI